MTSVAPGNDVGQVDENDPVVGGDLNAEGVEAKPVIDFATVPGYDNVRLDKSLLPPPPVNYVIPQDQKQPDFMSAPVISEDTARQSLLEHVGQQCCWGKGAAEKMTIKELQSSTSYHYVLETFTEERSTKWDFEPFQGQPVDGPHNGPAPGPWDIPVPFREVFKNETQFREVPHTAYVKDCHGCNAKGFLRCGTCHGRSQIRCSACQGRGRKQVYKNGKHELTNCPHCFGTGKRRCARCGGDGRIQCTSCKGCCRLRWFIRLSIVWSNNVGEHVVEKTGLPNQLVSKAAGSLGFQDTQFRVMPVARFPVAEINEASHRLLSSHQFPQRMIHMQRHVIRMVPVTQCFCDHKEKDLTYFVYGLESKVHAPDYPEQCCWGCSIM